HEKLEFTWQHRRCTALQSLTSREKKEEYKRAARQALPFHFACAQKLPLPPAACSCRASLARISSPPLLEA
uniref:Uncharacterized protein n=1 Tax=Oryza brachyantha TaxID=4533 RepID=J3KVW8_ORYBR